MYVTIRGTLDKDVAQPVMYVPAVLASSSGALQSGQLLVSAKPAWSWNVRAPEYCSTTS